MTSEMKVKFEDINLDGAVKPEVLEFIRDVINTGPVITQPVPGGQIRVLSARIKNGLLVKYALEGVDRDEIGEIKLTVNVLMKVILKEKA